MVQLCGVNSAVNETSEVVARMERELFKAQVQWERDLFALQGPVDADRDMLHTALQYRTRLQSLSDVERQMGQNIEKTMTASRLFVTDHSSFTHVAHENLYCDVSRRIEACLQSKFAHLAGRIGDCSMGCRSDAGTHLAAYVSSIQKIMNRSWKLSTVA